MSAEQLALPMRAPLVKMPDPDCLREAAFSDDRQYRWWLKRVWRAGPFVCWVMLNPSTADERADDPTMRRVMHFSRAWGYGGCVVVNLYPFVTPNPATCRRWADWLNNGPDYYARDRLHDNLDVVARHAKAADAAVAAWGAGAWDDFWTEHVAVEIITGEEPWPDLLCLGKTAGGAPIHPMARGAHRVPDNQQPIIWRSAA